MFYRASVDRSDSRKDLLMLCGMFVNICSVYHTMNIGPLSFAKYYLFYYDKPFHTETFACLKVKIEQLYSVPSIQ
jgi:hypothetical protein